MTFSWITTLGNALIIKESFITRWWMTKLFTPPSGYEFQKWIFITKRLDNYELVNNKLIWSSCLESLHAITTNLIIFPPPWCCSPTRAMMASPFLRFLDHTPWCITVSRIPLDEWSVCHRDLYLTTHNNHNRQTSMPPSGNRTHELRRCAAADLCLRLCSHWDRQFNNVFNKTYDTKIESWIMPEELDMFKLQQQAKNSNNPFPAEIRIGTILFSSEYFKISVLVNDYTWCSCVTYKYCPPAISLSNPLIDVSAFASRLTFPSFCFKYLPLRANELYMGSEVPTLEKSDKQT